MWRIWYRFVLAVVLYLAATPLAFSKVVITRLDDKGRWADLRIEGQITQTDADRFMILANLLRSHFEMITVDLNSPGGSVLAATQIGNVIRRDWFLTEISDGSDGKPAAECDSACVYVFAAGVARMAGEQSKIGIHRPYFEPQLFSGLTPEQAATKYDLLAKQVHNYLIAMGMDEKLFIEMMKVPSQEMRFLSYKKSADYFLIGTDPGWEEYQHAKGVKKYGEEQMRRFDAWLKRNDAYIQQCHEAGTSFLQCAKEFSGRDPNPLDGK